MVAVNLIHLLNKTMKMHIHAIIGVKILTIVFMKEKSGA